MGWIDLFANKILPEVVGERAAPWVFGLLICALGLFAAMPLFVLWITRQVARVRATLATTEAQLERLTQRSLETHTLVKDSFALVQERLAGVPPPTRFGPEGGPDAKPADSAAPPAPGEGQGSYNYCPGCKEIRFIKFFRCQTCGFHVPR